MRRRGLAGQHWTAHQTTRRFAPAHRTTTTRLLRNCSHVSVVYPNILQGLNIVNKKYNLFTFRSQICMKLNSYSSCLKADISIVMENSRELNLPHIHTSWSDELQSLSIFSQYKAVGQQPVDGDVE